jgi:hypothetical protein
MYLDFIVMSVLTHVARSFVLICSLLAFAWF